MCRLKRKAFSRAENQLLAGKAMGSVHYISPEQARGEVTGPQSDIYSVGVMMYEMLSGRLPFDGEDAVKVALKQIADTPRPLAEAAPDTPRALVEITEKAMAKLPANRYASASEMLDALRRYVQDPDVVFAYKYITEEAPAKVVKQTMSQKKDSAGAGARPAQKRRKKRSVFIPVLLGITVAFALACAALCYMILRNANNLFTDQKADIVLEDFVGMTRAEAEASAQISGGQINVDWVEEYSSTYGEGYIYKQSPTGGRNIREGQTVTLTVSLGTQYVTIPDVTNYVQADAEQLLRDSGLSVLVVQNVEPSVAVGAVIRTEPAAGTSVAAGSTVVVYVSRQQVATTTTVPSVVGLTVEDARTLLVQNRLTLGSQTQAYSDQPEGTVIAQETAAGATVKFNTRVNVTVSAGPEPLPEPEAPSAPEGGGDWWEDLWGGGSSSSSSSAPEGGGSSSSEPGLIWPWDWF